MNKEKIESLRDFIEKKVLEERGYVLVWMSAGNSYFKEEIIKKILMFTKEHYSKTIVMAPDEPAEHTFKAMGYTGNDIQRKARLNANLLQNRAKRIVASLKDEEKFHIVEWIDEIIPNKNYQKMLKEINELYNKNARFKTDANKTTLEVLTSKMPNISNLKEPVEEAVHYLLKELAFVISSPSIFNVEKITYLYHKDWPIYKKLISGFYDGKIRDKLDFLIYNP